MIIAGVYLVYCICKKYQIEQLYKKSILAFLVVLMIISGVIFAKINPTNPIKSIKSTNLETRFIIWQALSEYWERYPASLVFGNGVDTMGVILDQHRTDELRKYIPDTFLIDRAHNFLLDLIFYFGIIGCGVFLIGISL